MNGGVNFIAVVMILGAAQGFFLSILIAAKKKQEGISAYLLSILLFVDSLLFLMAALHQARATEALIIVGPVIYPMLLVLGPLLYLYIRASVEEDFKLKVIDILYFFPFLFGFFFLTKIYFLPHAEQVKFIEQFYNNEVSIYETIFRYFDIAYRAIFVILSIKLLDDFREKLKEEYSGLDKIDFGWLKQFLIYYLLTIFVLLIVTVFNLNNDYRIALAIYLAVVMYVIGYRFMSLPHNAKVKHLEETEGRTKYKKSGLTEEKRQSIKEKLLGLMRKEKVFTDPELTIGKLSNLLGESQNHVSQVINEEFKKNFYEFVNGYRIEYAKELLVSEKHKNESILSIAYEVGFQSKSTFNAVFKKLNNTTPSNFRKNYFLNYI